jgi:mannose-6-phosphate isomerase-like protein (cupin superfamily)
MRILRPLLLLSLLAGPALAQGAPTPPDRLFVSAADIQALEAKAKGQNDAKPAPLISQNLLSMAPYRANLEYRSSKAPASIHDNDKELMSVVDGSGTIITGGTIPDVKRTNPANQTGSDIAGGASRHIAKGDFLVVPEGVPHMLVPDQGSTLVLMTMRLPAKPAGN